MQELEIIAVRQREEIRSWITKYLTTATYKERINFLFTHATLSSGKVWDENMREVGEKVKANYSSDPKIVQSIEKVVKKYLKKSPEHAILQAKAYAWLKHIEENPPTDAWWFPHKAIEVAHKAFRLSVKLATFEPTKYRRLLVGLASGLSTKPRMPR